MKVKCYFNLHKKVFSVQHNGIVIAHKGSLVLRNATFKVSEAGRQRVLKEKRKNVHAYVIGELEEYFAPEGETQDVTYNPYLYQTFVDKKTLTAVTKADIVWLNNKTIKIKNLV